NSTLMEHSAALGFAPAPSSDTFSPGDFDAIGERWKGFMRQMRVGFVDPLNFKKNPVTATINVATLLLLRRSGRGSVVDAEVATGARTLTAEQAAMYGRVSRPAGFKEKVWELNRGNDGLVRDPSGKVLKFDEPWELGHTPGNKLIDAQIRAVEQGWSRQMWRSYQNDPYIYRPELPRTNLGTGLPRSNGSHLWEFTW
ncbi:MAG: hypothetical protein HZC55_00400, partial [Verrucomicrobia bacterium]|nr:hypothetical protein [Verrucomicrobiota bacterium]